MEQSTFGRLADRGDGGPPQQGRRLRVFTVLDVLENGGEHALGHAPPPHPSGGVAAHRRRRRAVEGRELPLSMLGEECRPGDVVLRIPDGVVSATWSPEGTGGYQQRVPTCLSKII